MQPGPCRTLCPARPTDAGPEDPASVPARRLIAQPPPSGLSVGAGELEPSELLPSVLPSVPPAGLSVASGVLPPVPSVAPSAPPSGDSLASGVPPSPLVDCSPEPD